jgi:hypothetical protein
MSYLYQHSGKNLSLAAGSCLATTTLRANADNSSGCVRFGNICVGSENLYNTIQSCTNLHLRAAGNCPIIVGDSGSTHTRVCNTLCTPILCGTTCVRSACLYSTGNTYSDNYLVDAGDGQGIKFWNGSNSYRIMMSAVTTANAGRLWPTSDYNMYFRMKGTDGAGSSCQRGFVWQEDDGSGNTQNLAHLNHQGLRFASTSCGFICSCTGCIKYPIYEARYSDGNTNYRGFFCWNKLQLGNNGANQLIAGDEGCGGRFEFIVNNCADGTANPNGTTAMVMCAGGGVYGCVCLQSPRICGTSCLRGATVCATGQARVCSICTVGDVCNTIAGQLNVNCLCSTTSMTRSLPTWSLVGTRYLPTVTASANLPVGWHTIFVNAGNRAGGRFVLRDTTGSRHQYVVFYATHSYGSGNSINVLSYSRYSGQPMQCIRIKDFSTYDGAALQVYVCDATNNLVAYEAGDNIHSSGWYILTQWCCDACVPYSNSCFNAWWPAGCYCTGASVNLHCIQDGGQILTGKLMSEYIQSTGTLCGHEICTQGWFRNSNSGAGLFNAATGAYWYSNASTNMRVQAGCANNIGISGYACSADRGCLHFNCSNQIHLYDSGGNARILVNSSTDIRLCNTVCQYGNFVSTGRGYFHSVDESLNFKGARGCFTNQYMHLYNKVGIGNPSGWGCGETNTPSKGLSTYGGICIGYGDGTGAMARFIGRNMCIGTSGNWDTGSLNGSNTTITNVHFQGHNDFWIGAGNSSWWTTATTAHHDLLINTMLSDATYTRGITFTASNAGASTYRMGRWRSGCGSTTSGLLVDGKLGVGLAGANTLPPESLMVCGNARFVASGGAPNVYLGTSNGAVDITLRRAASKDFNIATYYNSGWNTALRVYQQCVYGCACFQSPVICGTSCLRGATVCGTNCVQTPIIKLSGVNTPIICGPAGHFVISTDSNCSMVGATYSTRCFAFNGTCFKQTCELINSNCVQSPVICGTSCVASATITGGMVDATLRVTSDVLCATGCVRTPSIDAIGTINVSNSGNICVGTGGCVCSPVICATGCVTAPTVYSNGANMTSMAQGLCFWREFMVCGDADTFYPVCYFRGNTSGYKRYSMNRSYNSTAPDTWYTSTHKGGLNYTWEQTTDTQWGGNDRSFRVNQIRETYTSVIGGHVHTVSGGVVLLRGGGALYCFASDAMCRSCVCVYDGAGGTDSQGMTHSTCTYFCPGNCACVLALTCANAQSCRNSTICNTTAYPLQMQGVGNGSATTGCFCKVHSSGHICATDISCGSKLIGVNCVQAPYILATNCVHACCGVTFTHSNWSGEKTKIQAHSSHLYFQNGTAGGCMFFRNSAGTNVMHLNCAGCLYLSNCLNSNTICSRGAITGCSYVRSPGYIQTGSIFYPWAYSYNCVRHAVGNCTCNGWICPLLICRGGSVVINGGSLNTTLDAALFICQTTNNDWGQIICKHAGTSDDYGLDIRVGASSTAAMYARFNNIVKFRLQYNCLCHSAMISSPVVCGSTCVRGGVVCATTGFYGDGSNLTNVPGGNPDHYCAENDRIRIGRCNMPSVSTTQNYSLGSCIMTCVQSATSRNNITIGHDIANYTTAASNGICYNSLIGAMMARKACCNFINNIVIGYQAGYNMGSSSVTGAQQNIIIGSYAGSNYSGTFTGCENAFIGTGSGYSMSTGCKNSGIGRQAGKCVTTGSCNVFLGFCSGCGHTTGTGYSYVGSRLGCCVILCGNTSVCGSLSKTSGCFKIAHPNPAKRDSYDLVHSFVESPTEGDNIYRYTTETTSCRSVIELPDYYSYLNKNDQVWVSANKHFGVGYGEVTEDQKCLVVCSCCDGIYNVLLIGTRKDNDAVRNWNGPEIKLKHPDRDIVDR